MTTIDQPTTDPENDQQHVVRHRFTQGLRDLAEWIEQHPELDLPYGVDYGRPSAFSIGILGDEETIPERLAAAIKALGGARTKEADDGYMRVQRTFGPGVVVEIWATRDRVCEAVVVGREQIEVEQVVQPAVTETVIEERDIVEWRCAPILTNAVGIADSRASLGGQP